MFVGGFLLRGTPTYPTSSVFHDGFNPPNFPFSLLLHEIHGNVMVIAVSLLQMRCISNKVSISPTSCMGSV